MSDLKQKLDKIGPKYSTIAEKQAEVVRLIKAFEIETQMHCMVNQNIPGLRKRTDPFTG